MSAENRPEHEPHLDPPSQLVEELSLGATLYRLVDDLFTHQAIAERLQGTTGDTEMERLMETWKQGLTQQLEDTARLSVENVVAIIDLIQSGGRLPLSETERQEWRQIEAWHKPFTVSSICREDLRNILTDEEIRALDDTDMEDIADRMSDSYRDSGGYWQSLEIMAKHILGKKQAQEDGKTPDQPSTNPHSETSEQDNSTPS